MPSARKRRLSKLIKGYLNKIDTDGVTTFPTKQSKIDELARIHALPKGKQDVAGSQGEAWQVALDLQAAAGFPTTSNPDGDGATTGVDFAPFDGTEAVDTEGHGVGDNHTIVNLYNEIVALTNDLGVLESNAITQDGIVTTQKGIANGANADPGTCAVVFAAALEAGTTANSLVIGYATTAGEKLAEIDAKLARIDALPEPVDSTGDFNTPSAQTIWDTDADVKRAAALVDKNAIDVLKAASGIELGLFVSPC
tara:strand:+ start:85 stop:843 length:759 start_codon:yes stop_codon:yes gene_type:complete